MDLLINFRKISKSVLVFILAIFFASQSASADKKIIDNMNKDRRNKIFLAADNFLDEHTLLE